MGIAYTKLQYKDEIRLIRLESGIGNSQVKFNLVHARLGEIPTYDALSYMWGEGNSGSDPLCDIGDGRTLEVRQNLGEALRYLRLKDEVRVLPYKSIKANINRRLSRFNQRKQ